MDFSGSKEEYFVITNSDVEGRAIYEDLNLYIPNVYYFSSKEIVFIISMQFLAT